MLKSMIQEKLEIKDIILKELTAWVAPITPRQEQ